MNPSPTPPPLPPTPPAAPPSSVQVDAYIGLGANLGDPVAAVQAALHDLARLPATVLLAQSRLYRSAPVDAQGPDFINAVALLHTGLPPLVLLAALQQIERGAGRQRPYRNAPRTLDLDMLLYGDTVSGAPELTLPHPRMHLRRFVLEPLHELAPQLQLPGRGPVRDLLAAVADQDLQRWPPA